MIAAWMLLSVLLGIAVALGAVALDGVCRALRVSRRWTWLGALSALVVLTVLMPLRRMGDASAFRLPAGVTVTATSGTGVAAPASPIAARLVTATRAMIDVPVARAVRVVLRVVPPAADRWLLVAWIACSASLLVLGILVYRRLRAAQRTWPVSSLHGERVHVAPDAGPAVLGFLRGSIVVPPWLVECASDVQQVVVAHEREHVRARDPLLLTLGAVSVVLLPWNPAAWWMLARLRLAVELDCDRRVLGAGIRTRDYGTLLIDLAGRTTGVPLGAPLVGLTMLAERTTHLERRIVAMSTPRPRHAALRIAAGSLVALTAVLAACEARMPTSVDVDNMTAASAERAATAAGVMSANDSLRTYYVDGKLVTAAEAQAVAPGRIASIAVLHDKNDHSKGTVRIVTRTAAESAMVHARAGAARDSGQVVLRVTTDGKARAARAAQEVVFVSAQDSARFAGLIFIDGKRVDQSAMKQLAPGDIQGIEVIKGARAAELYPNDPAAAQGVIQITTKHAAK